MAAENLNPHVAMVSSAENRYRGDAAELFAAAEIRGVFLQGEMCPNLVIVAQA